MRKDTKIEFAPTDDVESLDPYIDWVIRALGYDPQDVWVSNESHLGDFAEFVGPWCRMDSDGKRILDVPRCVRDDWYAGQHNRRLLARLRQVLGMPVVWRSSVVDVAKRLRARHRGVIAGG